MYIKSFVQFVFASLNTDIQILPTRDSEALAPGSGCKTFIKELHSISLCIARTEALDTAAALYGPL